MQAVSTKKNKIFWVLIHIYGLLRTNQMLLYTFSDKNCIFNSVFQFSFLNLYFFVRIFFKTKRFIYFNDIDNIL